MVALLLLLAISGGGWSGASAQDLLGFEDIQHASAPFHQMSKRDLEFNQYVPAFRLRGEPSCEELRAMWRYSKREARRATSTNQIPRTRPYRYGRLRPFAPYGPRNHIYGTMVLDNRHLQNYRDPFYKGAFNKLRAMVGPRRTGAFNDLRKLVGSERKEGETSTGQLKNLLNMRLKEVAAEENVRDNGVEQPSVSRRRDPTLPIHPFTFQKEGFTETLLPGNPKLAYYQQQLSEPDKSFSDSVSKMKTKLCVPYLERHLQFLRIVIPYLRYLNLKDS